MQCKLIRNKSVNCDIIITYVWCPQHDYILCICTYVYLIVGNVQCIVNSYVIFSVTFAPTSSLPLKHFKLSISLSLVKRDKPDHCNIMYHYTGCSR